MNRSSKLGLGWMSLLLACVSGCGGEGGNPSEPAQDSSLKCQQVIDTMARCYPDLATEAICTDKTIAEFELRNLANASCQAIGDMGKADLFSVGGCGDGEHVCSYLFCCKDYHLTWFPSAEEDWNILSVVQGLRDGLPDDISSEFKAASRSDLNAGLSATYQQDVREYVGGSTVTLAVEYTQQLVEVPYSEFTKALPTEKWGVKLDHYLGGEVKVYQRDSSGRATRQIERMVLSPLPCDYESPLSNNDMTKVEVIKYTPDESTVNWRVMYSDNHSTVTDVGSVAFKVYDSKSTLITFHSAHKLNAPGGIPIPLSLIEPALRSTFLDHTRRYAQIVHAAN